MADARFTFDTNIVEVVRQIERGLQQIERNVQSASAKLAATDVSGTLGAGLANRLGQVTDTFYRQVARIESDLQRQFRGAERGSTLPGRVNFAAMAQAPAEAAQQQIQAIMTDVSRALQGAPPGQRQAILAQAQQGVERVTAGLNEIYAEAARAVDVGRRRAGVRGVTVPRALDLERLEQQMEQALIAGAGAPGATAADVRQARGRFATAAGVNPEQANRAMERQVRAWEDQANALNRVARQIEANARPGGGLYSPTGAREARFMPGLFYGEPGAGGRPQRYMRTEEGGLEPFELPQDPLARVRFLQQEREEIERNIADAGRQELRARQEMNRQRERADRQFIQAKERDARLTSSEATARAQALREARIEQTGRVVSQLGLPGTVQAQQFVRIGEGDQAQFFRRREIEGRTHYERITRSLADQAVLQRAKEATDRAATRAAQRELAAREALARQQRAAAARGGGGRGGSAGVFDALFGPGPGGRGGGLFSSERLLRQGASFGGYMVSAVAFGAVIGGATAAKDAIVDYRDSLTDLEIALDGSERASRQLLNALGDTARVAGANTGAAIDAAVRGIRAFGRTADASEEEAVGAATAEAASQLAVIAEKDLKDATGDIIAIASAFGLAGDELNQVNDAIAVAKRELGGESSEIAQGLAAIGVAASEVGFTLGETANLISLVQARTDQTGRAVATRLSRVFSIIGGSAGRSSIERLNRQLSEGMRIDTTASVRDQLLQISEIYGQLSDQQQGLVRNALGGSANTRELLPILQEPERLAEALNAQFDSAGKGADEFRRKSLDIAGTLRKIRGDIQGIVTGLYEAGAFDIFALALKTAEPFLDVLRSTLQLYNSIFGSSTMGRFLKTGIALTLQWAMAQRVLNAAQRAGYFTGVGGIGGRPSAERLSRADLGQQALLAGTLWGRPRTPAPRPQFRGARPGGLGGQMFDALSFADVPRGRTIAWQAARSGADAMRGAVTRLGSSLWAFVRANPILMLVGGLLSLKSAFDVARAQALDFAGASEVLGRSLEEVSGQGLRDLASDLSDRAAQNAAASGGPMGSIIEFFGGNRLTKQGELLRARAQNLIARADELEQETRQAARGRTPFDAFDVSTPESIADSFQLLDETGRSAGTQLDALHAAMARVTEGTEEFTRSLSELERLRLGTRFGDEVQRELGTTAELLRDMAGPRMWAGGMSRTARGQRHAASLIEGNLTDEAFVQGLTDMANQAVAAMPDVSTGSQQEVIDAVNEWVAANFEGYDELGPELQEQVNGYILLALRNSIRGFDVAVDPQVAREAAIKGVLERAPAAAREAGVAAALSGGSRGEAEARALLARLRLGEQQFGSTEELTLAIQEAELALQQALMKRIDTDAKLAEALLSGSDAIGRHRVRIQAVRDKLELATEGDERDELSAELRELERQEARLLTARASAERSARVAVGDEVGAARVAARNAYEELQDFIRDEDTDSADFWNAYRSYHEARHALARAEVERANARRSAGADPRNQLDQVSREIQNTIALLRVATPGSTEAENLRGQLRELRSREVDIVTETANEARLAAIDPRARVDVARIELRNARAVLANQTEGTKEFYAAQRRVRDAELAYAQAQRSLADAMDLAGIDPRSQLQSAEARIRAAERNLADQLQGTEDYYRALADLRDAQQALADAEIDYASVLRQLDIDLTDPVAMAREELQRVRDRIAQARESGAPQDVVDSLLIEERNAEARAEQAAFQQRMSDARIARDLGRMSHQEYLAYLEEEAARLRAIANRTRQQQDMLDQVELALKAANEELQGQFNLGDIRVPTPFEVRRAVAARAMGGDGASVLGQLQRAGTSVQHNIVNNIQIDGADFNRVIAYLNGVLGASAVGRRTNNARRV